MPTHGKNNLEELLECLGSQETPECEEHRYALKRALLCSKYFEETIARRKQVTAWQMLATSMFALALFVVLVPSTPASEETVIPSSISIISEPMKLTDDLVASYIDDRPIVTTSFQANTLTFTPKVTALNVN